MKGTKIICTIGPASYTKETLIEMARAGMDVVRLNMSHGTLEFHKDAIDTVRAVSAEIDKNIGILMDLQGPKIRTGKLIRETIELRAGEQLTLTTKEVEGDWNCLSINYDKLPEEAHVGEKILLDDGNIELKVEDITEESVICRILNGGVIRSFRGVNLPETKTSIPALTDKDTEDLAYGLIHGIDFVALSFVRQPEDIQDLRDRMKATGREAMVIAKVEKPEAIENIDAIINQADGIMVARGDLGAETSPQDVPIYQKMIIKKCNNAGKPVITATQMMESMTNNPRPTRAEANDVANAIFDGTDAVMLSGETALGKHPVETVQVMTDIAERTEKEIYRKLNQSKTFHIDESLISSSTAVCYSACKLSYILNPTSIVGFTLSGQTAALLSKFRPSVPIYALSPNKKVLCQLAIYRGVYGLEMEKAETSEELIDLAEIVLLQKKLCTDNDTVIMVGGVPVLSNVETNMIKIHNVSLGQRNF